MFGHDYYQFAPGVFSIRSTDDCRKALTAILAGQAKPNLNDLRLFLKAIDDTTVPGYLSEDTRIASPVSEAECIESIGGMLERRILELFSF